MAGITSLLCLFIIVGEFTSIIAIDYSKVDYSKVKTCKGKGTHTMVKFPTTKLGPACGKPESVVPGLDAKEQTALINKHNDLRRLARKKDPPKGRQPPGISGTVPNLEWDDELAIIAQRLANQCTNVEDECRDVDRFEVGQFITGSTSETGKIDVKDMIQSWYDDLALTNKKEVDKFLARRATGTFTAFSWADVKKMGCGAMTFDGGKKKLLVCNYGNFKKLTKP